MGGDLEEEGAVPASVNYLASGGFPERQSTKHEGAGMEGDRLPTILPMLADHLDGLKFLDGLLGDANPWED